MNERRYPQLPIPGVGVIVVGLKGVLLARRDKDPAKGLWSIPGGGVELGETQESTVIREVEEETSRVFKISSLVSLARALKESRSKLTLGISTHIYSFIHNKYLRYIFL